MLWLSRSMGLVACHRFTDEEMEAQTVRQCHSHVKPLRDEEQRCELSGQVALLDGRSHMPGGPRRV